MDYKKLNKIIIELYYGDITDLRVDCIVNAANNQLWMGAGVAGAIKRKGGIEIEKEAVKKGPIDIGEAVETTAGKLNAKYVIHAAVMGMDFYTNDEYIKNATKNSLILADKLKVKTIAFPALGTGVGRFPLDKCAKIMYKEVKIFDEKIKNIDKVIFALFSKKAYDVFLNELRKLKV